MPETPAYETSPNRRADESKVIQYADAEALRDHLDALNEDGQTPVAVGWDARATPFLITLIGPYAENEHVLFDSPWQGDIEWREGYQHCDECLGWRHAIEHLHYPVTVLAHACNGGDKCPAVVHHYRCEKAKKEARDA